MKGTRKQGENTHPAAIPSVATIYPSSSHGYLGLGRSVSVPVPVPIPVENPDSAAIPMTPMIPTAQSARMATVHSDQEPYRWKSVPMQAVVSIARATPAFLV